MKNSRLPREAAPGTDTEMNAPNILIRKKKPRKKPIETAVNTYIGNYCQRKCFNHLGLIRECEGDFNKLTEGLGDIPISFKEIKRMIDADAVMICKLPFDKRREYVSWGRFERLNNRGKDFWGE